MSGQYINLTKENIDTENICCAISDQKHAKGVLQKKEWLLDRLEEGHVFRKLDVRGKVFIEYAPLEKAWAPVAGDNYLYIYCLWVSGKYKGRGYGGDLLNYCIEDAKRQKKSGICIISSKKKKPFLSSKEFLLRYGFEVVDTIEKDYELLAISFDGTKPAFNSSAKNKKIKSNALTIFYSVQCPYINNCVEDIKDYCLTEGIEHDFIKVDTLDKAKSLPCIFNNWATYYKGSFEGVRVLNRNNLKKILEQ